MELYPGPWGAPAGGVTALSALGCGRCGRDRSWTMPCQEEFPSALSHLQSRVPHLGDIPHCDFLSQNQLSRAAGPQGGLRALLVTEQGAVLESHLMALTQSSSWLREDSAPNLYSGFPLWKLCITDLDYTLQRSLIPQMMLLKVSHSCRVCLAKS